MFGIYQSKENIERWMADKPELEPLIAIVNAYVEKLRKTKSTSNWDNIYSANQFYETETHKFVAPIHNLHNSFTMRVAPMFKLLILIDPKNPFSYTMRGILPDDKSSGYYKRDELTDNEKEEFDAMVAKMLVCLYDNDTTASHYDVVELDMQRLVFGYIYTDELLQKII